MGAIIERHQILFGGLFCWAMDGASILSAFHRAQILFIIDLSVKCIKNMFISIGVSSHASEELTLDKPS